MSAEAIKLVIQHSQARGAGLIALIMLADESADRRSYPRASISLPAWAKKCRCSKRALIDTVAKLVQDGHLFVVEDHRAQTATLYEIPVRGVKISKPLEVKVSAPLYREEPLERTSRADLQCTEHSAPTGLQATNVIPIRLLKRREA